MERSPWISVGSASKVSVWRRSNFWSDPSRPKQGPAHSWLSLVPGLKPELAINIFNYEWKSSVQWFWDVPANRHLLCPGWCLCRGISCLLVQISMPEKILCSDVKTVISRIVPKTKLHRFHNPDTETFQTSPSPTFSIFDCFYFMISLLKKVIQWPKWKAETRIPHP